MTIKIEFSTDELETLQKTRCGELEIYLPCTDPFKCATLCDVICKWPLIRSKPCIQYCVMITV